MMISDKTFLRRVEIRNYKSIGACDLRLGQLTMLVGRNGSGKSNFLDALRFVVEGLETSLDHAIKSRGGIDEVRRRSTGHPHNFSVELEFNLPDWKTARYGFEIRALKKGGFLVKEEMLEIVLANGEVENRFVTALESDRRVVRESSLELPPVASDRLLLVAAAGLPQFRPAYDALTSMAFYNLNPAQMRDLQTPDIGNLLVRDGANIASVVARIAEERPAIKNRIREYLASIVPDVQDFNRVSFGGRETLEFRQAVKGAENPWRFYASSMSDGTLRVLGILVAAMQFTTSDTHVNLVGIEEPETALHPAAAAALMDALREAAQHTQVIVTSHSPELLDQIRIDEDSLLVVQASQGATDIGPADSASMQAIREHLFSAGELLRMDQLRVVGPPESQREFDYSAGDAS
jgi:predicted ATPase